MVMVGVLIFGGLNAFSSWQDYQRMGGHELWRPALWEYSSVFMIGLLAMPIYQICDHLEFAPSNWRRRVLQHLAISLIFSVLHVAGMVMIRKLVYRAMGDTYEFGSLSNNFIYELSKDLMTYLSTAFICYGMLFYARLRKLHSQTLELQREMAELQLRRLREQLRPHFLFNSLNLISSCMYEDVEKADKLLADLATLLRYSLNKENTSRLPLAEERRFLELYWDLIDARFSGKMTLYWQISPECETAWVPCFMLQPIAENAIEHGFRPRGGFGTLRISAERRGDLLELCLADDGIGLRIPAERAFDKGLGLGNLKAILRQLYGDAFRFELHEQDQGGVQVKLSLPFQEAP